jgi:hypothetical protein
MPMKVIDGRYLSVQPGSWLDTSDTLDSRSGNSSINLSIEDFPKPLSCLSKVSSQRVPNGTRTRSPENGRGRC